MTNRRKVIRDFLTRYALLESVPPAEIARLGEAAKDRVYEPDEAIFAKGEAGTSVMIVVSGRVSISSRSIEGHPVVISVMVAGDMFGEIAAIDGGERTADARAMERASVLILERDVFVAFLERNAQVCLRLLRLFCERLRSTDETVEDLNVFNIHTRVAKRLLSVVEQHGEKTESGKVATIRMPQHMLAAMMGSDREGVSRALHYLKLRAIVKVEHGMVVILDADALRAEAGLLGEPVKP